MRNFYGDVRVTILMTGAAGMAGTGLRRALGEEYPLRLLDRSPIADLGPHEEAIVGDITDRPLLARAMRGVSGVIHLAACTSNVALTADPDINTQIEINVTGAYNVFEAAREAGVERVVFASTHHVVGFYPRRRRVGTEVLLRPDSRYGLTKAFGEQIGAMFADKYNLRVLCIRIGHASDRPADRRRLAIWCSWRDLAQLVRIGLTHKQLRYAVVYGVSSNTRGFFDNETAFRLGYLPQDDAEQYADQLLAKAPAEDPSLVGSHVMGGAAATMEFEGDIDRIYEW